MSRGDIRAANKMVSRVALLLWLIVVKGCVFALEQPQTSIMAEHDRIEELLSMFCI